MTCFTIMVGSQGIGPQKFAYGKQTKITRTVWYYFRFAQNDLGNEF